MTNSPFPSVQNASVSTMGEREEMLARVADSVLSMKRHRRSKAILNPKQMVLLTLCYVYGIKYRSRMATQIANLLNDGTVATQPKTGGQGRKDVVEIAKAILAPGEAGPNPATRGLMRRLFKVD